MPRAILACLTFFATLAIYLHGLSGPLLFDDKPALSANQFVKIDGTSFDEWRTAAFSSESGPLRRPIAMLTFAANHAFSGKFAPFDLKAVNLAIHLVIAVLLLFLFRALLRILGIGRDEIDRKLIALVACAIWLLHPLHVSTVLYAVQRMAQLAALFVLAGLLLFTHFRTRWAERGASTGELVAAALWISLLTALAVLSKENGALLPWVIIVLEVCVFRGMWGGQQHRYLRITGWVLLVLPVLLVMLLLALSPESIIGGYAWREFTIEQRLFTQGRLLWRYLGWICVPNINDMGFQHDDIPLSTGLFEPVTTFLSLVGWLALLGVSFLLRRRFPLLLLAVLFFLVGQSLESSLFPLEMVYEHRNYLPSTFVCLVMACVVVIPTSRHKTISVSYPIFGVFAVLCLMLFIRVQVWSNELTMSRINLEQHPESARSNFFYANALLRQYEHRQKLALNEKEGSESLLLARHYFERMYQVDQRQVGALAMLYYLDTRFFPELKTQVDWMGKLEDLLSTKNLQASDWNALDMLLQCFEMDVCKVDRERLQGLLDLLENRYPRSERVLQYRYRYLVATDGDDAERLELLQQAQAFAPTTSWIYADLLTELARKQNIAQMYKYTQLWLLHDRARYKLSLIKGMFSEPTRTTEQSNDT